MATLCDFELCFFGQNYKWNEKLTIEFRKISSAADSSPIWLTTPVRALLVTTWRFVWPDIVKVIKRKTRVETSCCEKIIFQCFETVTPQQTSDGAPCTPCTQNSRHFPGAIGDFHHLNWPMRWQDLRCDRKSWSEWGIGWKAVVAVRN